MCAAVEWGYAGDRPRASGEYREGVPEPALGRIVNGSPVEVTLSRLKGRRGIGGWDGVGILEEAVNGAYTCAEGGPRIGQSWIVSHLEGLVLDSSVAAFSDYLTRRCPVRSPSLSVTLPSCVFPVALSMV